MNNKTKRVPDYLTAKNAEKFFAFFAVKLRPSPQNFVNYEETIILNPGTMKNILVGIDFHERTRHLINKSVELARAFGSQIWLLHVAAPEPDFIGYSVGPEYIRDFRAKELKDEHHLLTSYVDQLKKQKIEADGLLLQGETVEVVLEESAKLQIDLIIFGHHTHSFMYKLFFGSHSAEIVNKSDIPVMVVPFND